MSIGIIEVIGDSKIATDAQRFIIDNLEAIVAFSKSDQYREQRNQDK